jgi:16S rRNA (cytidine1402-2'-O)-methyltransferase
VLAGADRIACEDTRHTARLLARHGINARLTAYHEHNATRVRPMLITALEGGESVALVSDAGTPLISDPGYKLVRAALDAGITVTGCPGPSAPLLALILSGLPTDRFYFAGFLPTRTKARRDILDSIAALDATLIFFESPRRLAASLLDMVGAFGSRPAAVARELTKLHEEVRRGSLTELADHYEDAGPPKGEIVVVVGGAASAPPGAELSDDEIDRRLEALLVHESVRDAATMLSAETGLARRKIYARAVALTKARNPCAI